MNQFKNMNMNMNKKQFAEDPDDSDEAGRNEDSEEFESDNDGNSEDIEEIQLDNENQEAEPTNLRDWVRELNDEYHSEDEGIEDYKIGGYHPCHIGEVLINRYVLIQKLGWGHFSTVWLAKDFKFGTYVAVKVMKSAPHYLDASYDEVEILQKIAKLANSPEWITSICKYKNKKPEEITRDDSHVLNLLNCFLYKGPYGNHFCMVYEILGVNLLEVLKRTDYKGLELDTVREMTRQVLIGLDFLNRVCKIIHTDLKPENVLVCLTDDEIGKIVEDGQLNNRDVFMERLRYYRKNFGFGNGEQSDDEGEDGEGGREGEGDNSDLHSEMTASDAQRISELQLRLESENLSKNARKTLRKKIKKLEEKYEEESRLNKEKPEEKKDGNKENKENKKENKKKQIRKDILSKAINPKLVFDKVKPLEEGFKIKIADLGNACWTHYHFATEIQTRQYRGPEVILGSKYNITADLWSLACMTFEMLTGDLLFNPKRDSNEVYGKNDDHIAQMMELLGIFQKKFTRRCSKFKKYFSTNGKLKRVPNLQQWSIKDFMIAKYGYVKEEAESFEKFMKPMLHCLPEKRATAQQMLSHPWLDETSKVQKMPKAEHEEVKARDYNVDEPREEVWNYESDREDASCEDNNMPYLKDIDSDEEWYGKDAKYKKINNIRLIDQSFTDVGYTGYSEGINLDRLDSIANWQFV